MSSDINRVNVTGHIKRDAERRVLPTGTPVVEFTVVVYDHRKQGSEWKDVAGYYECQYFGARAESLLDHGHLLDGAPIAIEGKLRQNRWEKDGKKFSKVFIVVDDISLPKRWDEAKPKAEVETSPVAPAQEGAPAVYDEEIPF